MVIFEEVKEEDMYKLLKCGFFEDKVKTIYEVMRLRKGKVTLIFYNSGKLLLQGKFDEVDKLAKEIKKLGIGRLVEEEQFRKEEGFFIGSDEALKGDTFGGIVVAAVKADEEVRIKLLELGVRDSKKLADNEVMRMAEEIKKIASCKIISLLPEEYNHHHHSLFNITALLNKMHKECAEYLKPGKHAVDKFPGCAVGEIQVIKGESKYLEIAAASVLARAAALSQLNYLSSEAGFTIPKGSTHVKDALQELKDKKLEFRKFVKLDFKNVKDFLS